MPDEPAPDIQSAVFRDAGPEQWTDDDQLAEMEEEGELTTMKLVPVDEDEDT